MCRNGHKYCNVRVVGLGKTERNRMPGLRAVEWCTSHCRGVQVEKTKREPKRGKGEGCFDCGDCAEGLDLYVYEREKVLGVFGFVFVADQKWEIENCCNMIEKSLCCSIRE